MNKMLKIPFKRFATFMLGVFFISLTGAESNAYIMPAEQLVYLMGMNFSNFKTLVISQTTHLVDLGSQDLETVFDEKIWLKSPGRYRSEIMNAAEKEVGRPLIANRKAGGDMTFRKLLLANDLEAAMGILSHMGINMESVSLTRLEGVIAYRVGNHGADASYLVIEKDHFWPILLHYRSQSDAGQRMITVRFTQYQEVEKGWYPYEITYALGEAILERYDIIDLQVNTPVEPPLSEIIIERLLPPAPTEPFEPVEKPDDGLSDLIEFFKRKF